MTEKLILKSATVGPWPMNSYVLICPDTRESILIDPGAEPETLSGMLAGSTPVAIVLTHAHHDHIGVLKEMKAQLGVPVYIHPAERLAAERSISDGDTFKLGTHELRLVHTPGHTPGMITIMLPDPRAIVGDTIFQGGPGRTWSAQDFKVTMNTMRDIVFQWPDETECFPGHGPSFRIGDERPDFEAFLKRQHPSNLHGHVSWVEKQDEA